MALFSNGIFGRFSGLVGAVVGSTWRTLNVMKSRPKKITKPATQGQLDQRDIFSTMNNFLAHQYKAINMGFKPGKAEHTAMNIAVAHNLAYAVTGVSPQVSIDFPKIRFSKGSLLPAYNPTLTAFEGRIINLKWTTHPDAFDPFDEEEPEERETDTLVVVLYNPSTDTHFQSKMGNRGMGTFNIELKDKEGDINHVWMFFISKTDKAVSSSQYLGTCITMA